MPFDRGKAASSNGASRKALVFVSDPVHIIATDSDLIAKTFDFTRAEALVARHLIGGEDVDDIARELNLSWHTVRNQMKHLYSKTNTHKHCELLHLLLRSPAALHLPSTPDS